MLIFSNGSLFVSDVSEWTGVLPTFGEVYRPTLQWPLAMYDWSFGLHLCFCNVMCLISDIVPSCYWSQQKQTVTLKSLCLAYIIRRTLPLSISYTEILFSLLFSIRYFAWIIEPHTHCNHNVIKSIYVIVCTEETALFYFFFCIYLWLIVLFFILVTKWQSLF